MRSLMVLLITFTASIAAADCFDRAGEKYNIPTPVLKAIADVESEHNPQAINLNYKTYDIGMMQVNSQHLQKLKALGIEAQDLYDVCTNIDVGAWILSREIARHGYGWGAIAHYHSPTPAYQARYVKRVAIALEKYR